ncbi:MAG: hypothetical protein MSL26_06175 [Clostridiales bacterium]|nr:hypothetical protein [Clostridiales bacterium]
MAQIAVFSCIFRINLIQYERLFGFGAACPRPEWQVMEAKHMNTIISGMPAARAQRVNR